MLVCVHMCVHTLLCVFVVYDACFKFLFRKHL